jgi:2'-5' RNA ligase
MRTFISIELSDEIKNKIGKLIGKLRETNAPVKWVEPKNLHITLKFLGEVPNEEIENLAKLTTKAIGNIKTFSSKFEGTGTFPGGKSPRVIWVGTSEGADKQRELAASLEKALSAAGYKEEKREHKSHITIGRVRERKNLAEALKIVEEAGGQRFGEVLVDHVNIMKSKLSPKGPTYEVIKRIGLSR